MQLAEGSSLAGKRSVEDDGHTNRDEVIVNESGPQAQAWQTD